GGMGPPRGRPARQPLPPPRAAHPALFLAAAAVFPIRPRGLAPWHPAEPRAVVSALRRPMRVRLPGHPIPYRGQRERGHVWPRESRGASPQWYFRSRADRPALASSAPSDEPVLFAVRGLPDSTADRR